MTTTDGDTPSCIPGEKVPYPNPPPPPTIMENRTYPFEIVIYPEWEIGIKAAAYSVAMFMAVVGNIIVILTIALNRHMRSSTNMYLVNLALSDLIVGSLNMWMHLLVDITAEWPFGSFICKVFPFLQILSLSAAVLFMTAIAGERFFAIVFPFAARLSKNYQHALVMFLIWFFAILVSVPQLLVRHMDDLIWKDYHQVWCEERWPRYAKKEQPDPSYCEFEYPLRQIYYNLLVIVMYFVPITIMAVAYSVIGYKMSRRQVPGVQTETVLEQQQKTARKVVRMLVVVFVAFILCWTPQEIFVFIDANWPDRTSQTSAEWRYVIIFIAYFNSSLNPFLYAGFNSTFRSAFRDLLHRCRTGANNRVAPATITDSYNKNSHDEVNWYTKNVSSGGISHTAESSAKGVNVRTSNDVPDKISPEVGNNIVITEVTGVETLRDVTKSESDPT